MRKPRRPSERRKRRRPWMQSVKKFSKRRNRQATRQCLHHERHDAIPQNKLVATEDPWGWD